uniref:HNH endonuclease n=1 Tax=Sphingomonas sp. NY01 TaxID=2968057 RepID=UPI00406C29CB
MQPDIEGVDREAIVFRLTPLRESDLEANDLTSEPEPETVFADLRLRALAAGAPPRTKIDQAPRTVFERSRDVRDYVLQRANGACEGCGQPAPFTTASGRPYLEAHHIRRLSDGGPDDIRYVAGICPNCHRRAHFSTDRDAFNSELALTVQRLEAELDHATG